LLNYRHSTHAGNFADVIKHIVVIDCLEHLARQDRPVAYIDTHAGAGLFELTPEHAVKAQKYSNGIAKLKAGDWPELASYFSVVQSLNENGSLGYYPGSPVLAQCMLSDDDEAWLYELYAEEFELLQVNIGHDRRFRLHQQDGYRGLHDTLASISGRAVFVLVDPPYESDTDYDSVVEAVSCAYKMSATGTYAIWYPVVDRKRIVRLEKKLISSGIRNIQRYELGITSDNEQEGMTAAGMIVVNPPRILMNRMSLLLPRLLDTLAKDDDASYSCDVLVAE